MSHFLKYRIYINLLVLLFLQCEGTGKGLFQASWNVVKPGWQLYRQRGKTNKWRRWRSKLWFVVLFTSNHGPLYPGPVNTRYPAPAQTCRRWLILNSTTQHSVTLHPLLWKPTPYLLQSCWLLQFPWIPPPLNSKLDTSPVQDTAAASSCSQIPRSTS